MSSLLTTPTPRSPNLVGRGLRGAVARRLDSGSGSGTTPPDRRDADEAGRSCPSILRGRGALGRPGGVHVERERPRSAACLNARRRPVPRRQRVASRQPARLSRRACPRFPTDEADAMRYLAELAWVPHAMQSNRDLEWREIEDDIVEVSAPVGRRHVAISLGFDAGGDILAAIAHRPRINGSNVVESRWVALFGEHEELGGSAFPAGRGAVGTGGGAVHLLDRSRDGGRSDRSRLAASSIRTAPASPIPPTRAEIRAWRRPTCRETRRWRRRLQTERSSWTRRRSPTR
jgi:Family of unknown function (DUF6544)